MALKYLLDVPNRTWRRLTENNIAALLDTLPWLQVRPDVVSPFHEFTHLDVTYYMPASHGMNMVALEYPIADAAFQDYLNTGKPAALLLLCATLCREAEPNAALAIQRGDKRRPLLSRSEATERAKALAGLDESIQAAVLYYFAGVKKFINETYGKVLFVQKEEEDAAATAGPSLGWWAIYFTVATDGPFGRDVEIVHQKRFHDVCLFLVNRIREQKEADMRARLQSKDFGQEA